MRAALASAVVIAVVFMVWMSSRSGDPNVLVGSDELQPGEIVQAPVSFEMYVRAPEDLGGRVSLSQIDAIYVTRGLDGRWHGLLTTSPWRGCRLQVVGAAGDRIRFLDPCHGGRYAVDGATVDAPGMRGITDVPLVVTGDGILVDLERLE